MPLERWSPTPRQGISAQRVMLSGCVPDDGVAYLAAAAGDSPFAPGEPLEPGTPLAHPIPAWFHPTTGDEPPHLLNSDVPIVGETPDVLVVDKPHGLPSTPNGRLMRATAQTLLRKSREEPDLVAVASESNVYLVNITDAHHSFGGDPIPQSELHRVGTDFSVPSVRMMAGS